MKKAMVIAIAVLITAFCCFAETQTITLVARVEKQYPQFVIRNNETGEIGSSVVYTTGQIARRDVRASFDVIQSTDSNGFNTITFTVSATELKAAAKHKVYSTDGVSIVLDGRSCGSEVSFERTTSTAVAAGTSVASFDVIWPTNEDLVKAVYQACITLTVVVHL